MNERIKELAGQAGIYKLNLSDETEYWIMEKFAELIVAECVNREALLGAIARGWRSEKNSHKTMDSDFFILHFG